MMLFYSKKYKYRATFCRAKAKEKSQWKILITNCRNELAMILKSGKQNITKETEQQSKRSDR